MATALDTKLRDAAYSVIQRVGKAVTFVTAASTYDITTGETTSTDTSYTAKVSPPEAYSDRFVDGNLVQRGDTKVVLPAKGLRFTPAKGMKVTIDGGMWRIVDLRSLYSGENVAAYEIQLRK